MSDFIAWAFERWPFAVVVLGALGFLYGGLLFGWGPENIRPVSAQAVTQQISASKGEVLASISGVQGQLKSINDTQDTIQKTQKADHLARLEQQLLWWRQQNCKSKGTARNYAWQKMQDLRNSYRDLTNTDWQMPSCGDIGD